MPHCPSVSQWGFPPSSGPPGKVLRPSRMMVAQEGLGGMGRHTRSKNPICTPQCGMCSPGRTSGALHILAARLHTAGWGGGDALALVWGEGSRFGGHA